MNDAEIASLLSLKEEQLGSADTSQWDAILEQYQHMREEVARVNKENDHLRVQLASVTGEVMTSNAISFADSDLAQLPQRALRATLTAPTPSGGTDRCRGC